jgi:hypothetical protein
MIGAALDDSHILPVTADVLCRGDGAAGFGTPLRRS